MNISHRITLLVALTLVAIFAIGGFAIVQSRSSAAEVRVVTEGVVPSALASADLVSALKDVQLSAIYLVYTHDEGLAAQAMETLSKRKSELQEAMNLQMKQADGDVQKGLVDQAKDRLAEYFSAIDDTAKFKLDGKTDFAQANLTGNVFVYERELRRNPGHPANRKGPRQGPRHRIPQPESVAHRDHRVHRHPGRAGCADTITVLYRRIPPDRPDAGDDDRDRVQPGLHAPRTGPQQG